VAVERLSLIGIAVDEEELTHLAVAKAVANREVTVGLGIYAAAAALGLAFVPLSQERYELVIPAEIWHSPAMQLLVELVRSAQLRETIAALGGYDTAETGLERWLA
jgi:putative molybdopterin biosynthesis protein